MCPRLQVYRPYRRVWAYTRKASKRIVRDPSGLVVIVVVIVFVEARKLIFGAGTASRSTSLTQRCQANIDSIYRNWGTRYRVFTLLAPPWPPFLLDSSLVSPVLRALHHELQSIEVNDISDQIRRSCAYYFFFRDCIRICIDWRVILTRICMRYEPAGRADISKSTRLRVQRDWSVATIQINLGPHWPHGLLISVAAWSFAKSIGSAA